MQFQIRGLVEGFYGTPWTAAQRDAALAILARHGVNAYFYGPKDDPFCCGRWFEPYDAPGLSTLSHMRDEIVRHGVAMHYMLAPGFSIRYASEADRAQLLAKYRQVYELGVRDFVLLLDDIPESLIHPEDIARYHSLVDAHADLALDLWSRLGAFPEPVALRVCPTQYWGAPDSEYLVALGRALPPEIGLIFTGDRICSWKLTSAEARAFQTHTGRRPLYWDNYPVNDAEMVDELHIGPLTGRDKDLFQYAEGMIMNPMEYQQASMIPLITAADYLSDPMHYDPDAAFVRAVAEVLGENYIAPMRWLNELCYKSCLLRHGHHYRHEPPERYHTSFDGLIAAGDEAALLAFARQTAAHMAVLRGCENQAFVRETARWLAACEQFAQALTESITLRHQSAPDPAAPLRAYLQIREDVMKHEAQSAIDWLS